jgi:serine/threonine protein kinase
MPAPLLPELPGYDNPQLIAHGASALVFRATQSRLGRPVAIKVITADTGSAPVNAARELATTVALSSQPHIVSIIDTGITPDDHPYIVMEYCEGGSYAQILRENGPLPVAEVLEVGTKIGEALHAAHEAGIVHRDVKPSNILRSRFGPALTDFGIARAPDELGSTLTREMMTPHHASPEALLHQAQSGLSDVYSLASTLWTLLTGNPPFVDPDRPAVDLYELRDRVLNDPVPPMPRHDVPVWLVSELGRAMGKLPTQRHPSAVAFAEALRRGALGLAPETPARSVSSRPVIPVGPVQRKAADVQPPRAPVVTQEPPTRPPDDPLDAVDGGWLPRQRPTPAVADIGPRPALTQSTRRFAEMELLLPARPRRGIVALLAAVTFLAIAAGAVATLLATKTRHDSTTASRTTAGASTGGPPTDVNLTDRGTSITVTWVDPSAGEASFLVVGSGPAGESLPAQQIPRGRTTAMFTNLSSASRYCFRVGAIYAYNRVQPGAEICTRRR